MRALQMMAACSLALAASMPPIAPRGGEGPDWVPGQRYRSRPKKGKGRSNRRGKGKISAPKRRPNRLHISKRVRAKHRKQR